MVMIPAVMKGGDDARDWFSHELRTPLTVIKAGIEILARADVGDRKNDWMVEGMQRAVARLEQLAWTAETVIDALDEGHSGAGTPARDRAARSLRSPTPGSERGQDRRQASAI